MSAVQIKLLLTALLLGGVALVYLLAPSADRAFVVGAWLAFAVITGGLVWATPVLHCPGCAHPTTWFDNYTPFAARLTGDLRRYILCRHCGSQIDRLNRQVTLRPPRQVSRDLSRSLSARQTRRTLALGGGLLIFCSLAVATLVGLALGQGAARPERATTVLVGCGSGLLAGLGLLVWSRR